MSLRTFRLKRSRSTASAPLPLLCRWDLDKTYLRSEFDTLRQLWRTAREKGEDKVEVPGVPLGPVNAANAVLVPSDR